MLHHVVERRSPVAPEIAFTFHRGSLALDFIGTLGHRGGVPVERIPDLSHLEAWLRGAALVDVDGSRTRVTSAEFREAIGLRETLAHVGFARAGGRRASPRAIDALNAFARTHPPSAIELDDEAAQVRHIGPHLVRGALGTIARDGIETFATRADRLVVCALDSCGALLLSSAHGPKRRWCAASTCANAANVAAFRARSKAARA